MRWFALPALLALLPTATCPMHVFKRGEEETPPPPPEILVQTEGLTIVWCTPSTADLPETPKFRVNGTDGHSEELKMARVSGRWCLWQGLPLDYGVVHLEPGNQVAANVSSLTFWYAPKGADVSKIVISPPQATIPSHFGQYRFEIVPRSGPVIMVDVPEQQLWRADQPSSVP